MEKVLLSGGHSVHGVPKILVFFEAPYLVQFLEQKENKSTETKRTYSTNQDA